MDVTDQHNGLNQLIQVGATDLSHNTNGDISSDGEKQGEDGKCVENLSILTSSGGRNDPTGWGVVFNVTNPGANGGVIIQHITVTSAVRFGSSPTYDFYEAWTVGSNGAVSPIGDSPPRNDLFRIPVGFRVNASAAYYANVSEAGLRSMG